MQKFLLPVVFSFFVQPVLSASFNCDKARSKMEHMICSDAQLSAADEQLNIAYRHAVQRSEAKPVLTQWQRDWLSHSDEVRGCNDARCLTQAFLNRTLVLKSVAAAGDEAARWHGNYVPFRNGKTDPESGSLLLVGLSGGRVYISGSALWYGSNPGQVNTGQIEGIGVVKGSKLVFDHDGCKGVIRLSKGGVAVEDESGCGGLNVSFNGNYGKK